MLPPFVNYDTEQEYRNHYYKNYCSGDPIMTADNIRVYFPRDRFKHAFFESIKSKDDTFSEQRSIRINWIRKTLENSEADLYQGWDKEFKTYRGDRRVSVVYENFVIILDIRKKKNVDELKAEFVTCFVADDSIDEIRQSPEWNKFECLKILKLKENAKKEKNAKKKNGR